VLQEQILKGKTPRCEALGMLGLLGSFVSCLQVLAVEREPLTQISWTPLVVLCLLGFQACLFGVYVLTSAFLVGSDAALFNLSLLTSDVYSIFISWGFQHHRPSGMYCVAFVTTMSGLVVYNLQPSATSAALSMADAACSLTVALTQSYDAESPVAL
jgi:solute carrier family 35 protein F1/2